MTTCSPLRDRRAAIDLGLLALTIAAATLSIERIQPASGVVILLAMCLVPGAAFLARAGTTDSITTLAIAVGLSLALDTAVASVLAWTGWWHPALGAAIVAAAAAGLLIDDLRGILGSSKQRSRAVLSALVRLRPLIAPPLEEAFAPGLPIAPRGIGPSAPQVALPSSRPDPPIPRVSKRAFPASAVAWLSVVVAVGLWSWSLHTVDLDRIGRYGLSASLPASWYAALAVTLAGAVWVIFTRRFHGGLAAAFVVVAVVVVYATIPAVTDVPQYAWTYKHIGVTESIGQLGSVTPLVDIYHRWPGFFALAAAFSSLSGLANPTSYAGWAEPLFSLIGALLVAAIARSVSRDSRVAVVAALFFTLSAWVAQSYFAPQPLAFLLGLTLMLVVLRQLTDHSGFPSWVARFAGVEADGPGLGWSRPTTLAVVIGLDAVVVETHQLSPYMILLALAPLAVFGVLRPRWILLPTIALPVAYLLPNLSYVTDSFSLFTNVDPSENGRAYNTIEPWLVAHAGGVVEACMWALAVLAVVGLTRRRTGATPLMLLALALAPGVTLFGFAYGGETSLRFDYFAAPWLSVLVAWGLVKLPRPGWRAAATCVALGGVTVIFLLAFFGRTATNVIPRDEVATSTYFYDRAPPRSLLVLVNSDFPMRLTARYTTMRPVEGGDNIPNLMERQNAPLVRAGSVAAVVTTLRQLGAASDASQRFLVFSSTEASYANLNRILSFADTRSLEAAVAGSPEFRLWHRSANAQIYEEVGG